MRLEIYMHPLNIAPFGFRHRSPDKLSTNATPPELWMHKCVKNERMFASIPCQINETYQAVFLVSTDERQAAT